MSGLFDVSVSLVRRWVDTYTKGVPSRERERRRAEMLSDLWEQEQRERGRGTPSARAGLALMARAVRGAPGDVAWRAGKKALRTAGRDFLPRGGAPRRPRGPGVAYVVLAIVLLIVLASVAFTSRQAPPPTIAEFAPRAVEQITDGGADLAGAGGRRSGQAEAAEDPAVDASAIDAQAVDVARVRQCVGNPPRQVEDPQSPPCVPYWSGDNGGATSHGVTRDEVRIVVRDWNPVWGPALETFFNKRFEFYGRKLRFIPRAIATRDPPGQRAAANAVFSEHKAFAATVGWCGNCEPFLNDLARLGVIGSHLFQYFPDAYLAARRPYLWSYQMANNELFATTGDWFCARLSGGRAVHAGDPVLQATPRKAGIVMTNVTSEGTSGKPMNDQLATCGARTDAVVETSVTDMYSADAVTFMENAILQMKTSGVTTVAVFSEVEGTTMAMRAATNQGYFPEWIFTSYLENDDQFWIRSLGSPEQTKALMLLLSMPMVRSAAEHPSAWAIHDSGVQETPESMALDILYRPLLLVASGIQLAGPQLTPETFQSGLHKARFPNPPHRIMAGAVGFMDGDYTMTEDVAEMWWSNSTPDPYGDPGAFCYVDGGARRRLGTFPSGDPFFTGTCYTGGA